MTDHKNEAIDRLEMVYLGGATDSERANGIAAAQVHATLYLAEQQRIANLITYWQLHTPRTVAESQEPNAIIEVHQLYGDIGEQTVEAFIQDGLGIS